MSDPVWKSQKHDREFCHFVPRSLYINQVISDVMSKAGMCDETIQHVTSQHQKYEIRHEPT